MAEPKNTVDVLDEQAPDEQAPVEQMPPALPPELAARFVTEVTAPTGDQLAVLRANAYAIALAAEQLTQLPASRERSLALTAVEEALMWANKAVFS